MTRAVKREVKQYAPEVRERAVRMVLEHSGDYPSRWADGAIRLKEFCHFVLRS